MLFYVKQEPLQFALRSESFEALFTMYMEAFKNVMEVHFDIHSDYMHEDLYRDIWKNLDTYRQKKGRMFPRQAQILQSRYDLREPKTRCNKGRDNEIFIQENISVLTLNRTLSRNVLDNFAYRMRHGRVPFFQFLDVLEHLCVYPENKSRRQFKFLVSNFFKFFEKISKPISQSLFEQEEEILFQ